MRCIAQELQSPKYFFSLHVTIISRPLGYERVYLPLCKVADTPSHIQEDVNINHVYCEKGCLSKYHLQQPLKACCQNQGRNQPSVVSHKLIGITASTILCQTVRGILSKIILRFETLYFMTNCFVIRCNFG